MRNFKNAPATGFPNGNGPFTMLPAATGSRTFRPEPAAQKPDNDQKKNQKKNRDRMPKSTRSQNSRPLDRLPAGHDWRDPRDDPKTLRLEARLDRAGAADWLGCSADHLAKIERGQRPATVAQLRLLRLAAGRLDDLGAELDGWRIRAGHFVSPEGIGYTPGEVRAVPWQYGVIRALQAAEREWKAERAAAKAERFKLQATINELRDELRARPARFAFELLEDAEPENPAPLQIVK